MKNFNNVNLTAVEKAMVCDYTVSKDDPNAFLYSDGKYYDFQELLNAVGASIPEDEYEDYMDGSNYEICNFEGLNPITVYDICFHPENYITNEKYSGYDWYFNVEDEADLWNLDEDEPNYEQIKAERIAEAEKQLPELTEELKKNARQALIDWEEEYSNHQFCWGGLETPEDGCPFGEDIECDYFVPTYSGMELQFYLNNRANLGLSNEIQELAKKIGLGNVVSNWKLRRSIDELNEMEEHYKEEYDYDEEYA